MMRHAVSLGLVGVFVSALAGTAEAMPVYLRLDSRFPSGHHPQEWLENRTRKVQFQRWFRVKVASQKDAAYGWLPEDYLVTPLKLAGEAEVTENLPARSENQLDSIEREVIAKGTRVSLIDVQGSWAKVRRPERGESYVPTESLKAIATSAKKIFLPRDTQVFVLPGLHAKIQETTKNGRTVGLVKETKDWIEIRERSLHGFVRRSAAVTLADLAQKGARISMELAPLRSAPLPYADLVQSLSSGNRLEIIQTETLRWGFARIPSIGEIWWPMSEEREDLGPTPEKLATSQLFRRKIFDMASSPSIPKLKFVSAQGLFRTIDGTEWTKIPVFQDKNYPIAVAGGGSVFVGPYISDDHGETFEQWIRWDTLVATLRGRQRLAPRGLQILDIRPKDPAGRRVALKLDVGWEEPVRVVTDDQGRSWRRE